MEPRHEEPMQLPERQARLPAIAPPLVMLGTISIVDGHFAIGGRDVAHAAIEYHKRTQHETPGGGCEDCGVGRVTIELFGS